MKKFIIKLVIFVLIIAMPLLILNHLYKATNFYLQSNELYWLRVHPQNIELLTLGNSHEKNAIRLFDKYDGVSHNFATSSQPFYYDYWVLNYLEESLTEGAIVIIPISLFDWYYNWMELFEEDVVSYNRRYYSLLPTQAIYHYNFEDDVKYNYLPILTAKENIKYIWRDVELPLISAANYTQDPTAVMNAAGWKSDSWKNSVMKYTESVKQENLHWFRATVELCYSKGYQPVIISTPIPYTLTEKFDTAFLTEVDDISRQVVAEYPGLLFLDYSQNTTFTHNLGYYRDADHMNTYGADTFSQTLLEDLASNGYIAESKLLSHTAMTTATNTNG